LPMQHFAPSLFYPSSKIVFLGQTPRHRLRQIAVLKLQTFAGQCAKSILLLPGLCDEPSPTQALLSKLVDPPNLASENLPNCVEKSNLITGKMLNGSRLAGL
jgi:hypothetical protein